MVHEEEDTGKGMQGRWRDSRSTRNTRRHMEYSVRVVPFRLHPTQLPPDDPLPTGIQSQRLQLHVASVDVIDARVLYTNVGTVRSHRDLLCPSLSPAPVNDTLRLNVRARTTCSLDHPHAPHVHTFLNTTT
ncbi:uncharacterized protein LOC112494624 [Cephus cinctus]|uniref:Uncharacterized protein LOC112494624 n=1 Tax=Cephus cinctus TaxID=211228 RepID=A0AAJ7RLS1_CEPCN|nr:uncharacterized protein LOC112494624 [Cephus cinctus]